jgi:hypothetical protein
MTTVAPIQPQRTPEQVRSEVRDDEQLRELLREATAELLTATQAFVGRYVVLPDEAASVAVALYVLHTWTTDAADATPYLVIVSDEKGSGKTRLLETLAMLVRKPWHTSSTTESALFRKIAGEQPTLLLDEVDTIFTNRGRNEPLRAILNAGNRRGSTVTRCEGKETREFSTFSAKVLAGLGADTLPATVQDRSIVIQMRKRAGEQVQRMRVRVAEEEAQPLVLTLEAWAAVAVQELACSTPSLPPELSDRAADAWEPLLSIADFAGTQWAESARTAARTLNAPPSSGVALPAASEGSAGLLRGMRLALGVS